MRENIRGCEMKTLPKLYRKLPVSMRKRLVKLYKYTPSSHKIVNKNIDGINFELDLSRLVHAQMYHYGFWEEHTTNIIKDKIKKGMVALDIGASSGVHALRMASLGAMTYAFEPSNWMYQNLVHNISLNKFDNIKPEKIALSNFIGKGKIESTEHGKLRGRITEPEIDIKYDTVDNYYKRNKIKRLDFIKIDTDGFEVKIIEGGIKTIKKYYPWMVIEFRPSLFDGLIDILKDLGYKFYKIESGEEYKTIGEIRIDTKGVKNVLCC